MTHRQVRRRRVPQRWGRRIGRTTAGGHGAGRARMQELLAASSLGGRFRFAGSRIRIGYGFRLADRAAGKIVRDDLALRGKFAAPVLVLYAAALGPKPRASLVSCTIRTTTLNADRSVAGI